jgi:hypothetical protein
MLMSRGESIGEDSAGPQGPPSNTSLTLTLEIWEPEVVAELSRQAVGSERTRHATAALRLGVLALREARGEIDARTVQQEGERLVSEVKSVLHEHAARVAGELTGTLGQFLDPRTGVLTQRLESLVRRDGELDAVLARHLSGETSELARTLALHVGERSPLFRILSPTQADGLLATLSKTFQEALDNHTARLTAEFSLDHADSALARLVREVLDANGQLKTEFRRDFATVAAQFSLDHPDSALSRLVAQVDRASNQITAQFSLDLDDSALNRLRRELLRAVEELAKSQSDFQADVRATLEALRARKQEAARSTRHGGEFEEALCETFGVEVRRLGDLFEPCGATTGRIAYSKVGDALATLGPDSAAPGVRIVLEAKAQKGWEDERALEELSVARENRGAQVGIFVFAKRVAPPGLEPLVRFGNDLLVVWDEDDPSTDVHLTLAYSVARALVVAATRTSARTEANLAVIDAALAEVRKRAESLDDVTTWAQTIKNSSEKIEARVRGVREALATQVDRLLEELEALKGPVPD